jgi:pyruvate/2-oxoglutarate/acetoin dehydrogenase E1 component/TPP-dependent pyruvate/acetoin dehydrogenase alpha subunit
MTKKHTSEMIADTLPLSNDQLIADYRLAYRSRQAAIIGRREVLTGKAKFGIFGDGKELPQLAMAHFFRKGDWRSGYYRDQTWMMAMGHLTLENFFAQLYAHADPAFERMTGGRNMNGHFATPLIDENGNWLPQVEMKNSSSDMAPTAAHMPRTVGLAYASVLYRNNPLLKQFTDFSHNGDEVVWATIGNASTAQGKFWETVNAIGVLKAPAIISVYDDGYGISVPNQFQMVKENIFAILQGFRRDPCPAEDCDRGYDLYQVEGWDYQKLLDIYEAASFNARKHHIPALVHVTELTQPQGHSTSGSHERYKTPERLEWERQHDCVLRYRNWLVKNEETSEEDLTQWETEDLAEVEDTAKTAYQNFQDPLKEIRAQAANLLTELSKVSSKQQELEQLRYDLNAISTPLRRDSAAALQEALRLTRAEPSPEREALSEFTHQIDSDIRNYYKSFLFSDSPKSPLKVQAVPPAYSTDSPTLMGFEVINACFDAALAREPRLVAFGEDVGYLGDVNQGFRGLQDKYGAVRVIDTGIREDTILGQAIGLALRGLRPIAEIQYLDYLLYALQTTSDDLATLRWRTAGQQQAPVIIRTRGHRLEGIWHSGSPMAGIIHLVRGVHVLVPRDMTRAAGFYNTLLQGDDPAIVVEVLNGYRVKERLPDNIGELSVPLGVPEILRPGNDLTLVTYGACVRIALEAAEKLAETGIEVEVIDVQSLLPFDLPGVIGKSLQKTSRVLFVDEDVPGGTTAYMLQQTLVEQDGYRWLDSLPVTLSASEHRPAYGSDGDYYSKPNRETIFRAAYSLMREYDPARFPEID